MDIKFLFGWAKENGIELPTNGDGNINIPASLALYDEWKKKGGKGDMEKENTQSDNSKTKGNNVVELDENSELARLITSSEKNKYDVIRRYLIENFGGRELELSDGKKAVIDNSDAKELAHKADNKRTAEIAELENIIKKAQFLTQKSVEHNKFTAFRYYTTSIQYKHERSEIVLNIGVEKTNMRLHLYAITNRPLKQ